MNKSTNVPPGPSLKGGKNRTRRGGRGNYPRISANAPNTLKKYPARRELLPLNNTLKKYPARRQLLPFNNTLKKYPARRELLPFNNTNNTKLRQAGSSNNSYINGLESERKKLKEEIMKLIDKTNISNNSKEHDLERLNKRLDEIDKIINEIKIREISNINRNVGNQVRRNINKTTKNLKNRLANHAAAEAELNALTKGGKRKTKRSRK
jgi:hypothetical protein